MAAREIPVYLFTGFLDAGKSTFIQSTLECGPTIERELLQLQGDMGRVIGANYSEILKVFNTASRRQGDRKTGSCKTLPSDKEIIDRV